METVGHVPVLLEPVLAMLDPKPGEVCVDATLGRGGHAASIIPMLGPGGQYIGLDTDESNAEYARARLAPLADAAGVTLTVRHANYTAFEAVLATMGLPGADLLLADLGFASNQIDDGSRGFSFNEDAPLDMRLDRSAGQTAADLIATLPERELADLIYQLGEERRSRKIAAKIAATRATKPIQTTRQLADLVRSAHGSHARGQRIDPATRTFMALRIAVNGELAALDRLLELLPGRLQPGGRAAIISFHSLEDRPIKRAFAELAKTDRFALLTRKPITASEYELAVNPRSRSAKLRGLMRMKATTPRGG